MRRLRLLGLSLAMATAASVSLTTPSPVGADSDGPMKNVATQMCMQPDSPFQGATIVQVPCPAPGERNTQLEWDFVCFDSTCNPFHVRNHATLLCRSTRNGATNG